MIEIRNKRISREYLANPFPKETYKSRLIKSNSIDLRDNIILENLGNGYLNIKIIDKGKILK